MKRFFQSVKRLFTSDENPPAHKPIPEQPAEEARIFREVNISETRSKRSTGAVPIPQRDNILRQSVERFRVYYSTPAESFVEQAKRYESETIKSAKHVPFMQYWPTYESMTREQLRWYFYWRTQLREGNYIETDLSYLFVYVYEVINLIGFRRPSDAANHLVKFWGRYRVSQPKLDNYLPDWIADFIIIHRLSLPVLEWYSKVAKFGAHSDKDLLIEAWLISDQSFEALSNEIIYRLASYNPTKSKFYKQFNGEVDIDGAYKRGLHAVNQLMLATQNQSLFEHYKSKRSYIVRRYPFVSAVHTYPPHEISIAEVHLWHYNEPLADALKNIIKYTENLVREENGYRYKLREIELPPEWQSALDQAFGTAQAPASIEIDLADVEALRQESEAIRERLIAEDGPEESSVPAIKPKQKQPLPALDIDTDAIDKLKADSDAVRGQLIIEDDWIETAVEVSYTLENVPESTDIPLYLQRPDNTPEHLLTDLQEIGAILGKYDSVSCKVITAIMQHDWSCETSQIQAVLNGQFANVTIDQINEIAMNEIGDLLVIQEGDSWMIDEEYRDEITHILNHPAFKQSTAQEPINDDLDEDWSQFVNHLSSYHWDAIAIILNGTDVTRRLDGVAQHLHKTGNILIDEINEIAQDSLGDILIDTVDDTPMIIEEESENVADALDWAVNTGKIKV